MPSSESEETTREERENTFADRAADSTTCTRSLSQVQVGKKRELDAKHVVSCSIKVWTEN